jgi:hypothetical protein
MAKTALITIVVMILLPGAVYGQDKKISGFVELQTTSESSGTKPQLKLSLERPLTKRVGLFGYGQLGKGYSEAYGGLTYSLKPGVQVAGGAGAESSRNFRLGGYVSIKHKQYSNQFFAEGLGSGWWYKDTAHIEVSKNTKVGLRIQRFKGIGPDAQYGIPGTPLKVWTAVMFGDHKPVAQFGLRWSF